MVDLSKDIQFVKGVGPSKSKLLQVLGINTLNDLITYYPRDYEDRSQVKNIASSIDGEKVLINATVITDVNVRMFGRYKSIEKVIVNDGTENCLITWFNQPYIKQNIKRGNKYKFFGKLVKKGGQIQMNSPIYEEIEKSQTTGKIVPVYPLTYELNANALRKIMQNGLETVGTLDEILPDYIVKKYSLIDYNTATKQIHFPDNFEMFRKARRRLVFDELLSMQLGLLRLKGENVSKKKGIKYSSDVKMSDIINDLPYKLTNAQIKVLEEIDKDMENEKPMNRLLQGDVGSGKTIVSIIASYKAVKSGYQVAVLAPTMILANQHFINFKNILENKGIKIELLVGGMPAKKKKEVLKKVADGNIDILIGTHAILEENVEFSKLGLVVTDEQHRFGVKQRSTVIAKGENPDVLVMTATPIPRTLGLILYGDLDISIIDELPKNRIPIETFAVPPKMTERVNDFIKKEIENGRQVYIVCPLVEETEKLDNPNLKDVQALTKEYKDGTLKNYRIECLHGKMKSKKKDEIMQRFKDGKIDVLISTTVIEVGIDVPNASIMVIENAERFGLAQLHQLRGRVGRGQYKSYCILKYTSGSEECIERMKIMTETNNGFVIAEKDMQLRGTGDFFGTAQHGLPEFKIANLFQDMEELKEVQALAIQIIQEDPNLSLDKNRKIRKLVDSKFTSKEEITI